MWDVRVVLCLKCRHSIKNVGWKSVRKLEKINFYWQSWLQHYFFYYKRVAHTTHSYPGFGDDAFVDHAEYLSHICYCLLRCAVLLYNRQSLGHILFSLAYHESTAHGTQIISRGNTSTRTSHHSIGIIKKIHISQT